MVPGTKFVGKVQKRHTGEGEPYKRVIFKPATHESGGGIPYTDLEFVLKIARYFNSCDGQIEKIRGYWEGVSI